MKNGIIIKNITDLRAKPDFRSERKSQLLFNEPVRIERYRNGYYQVIQPDGYSGWVNGNAVKILSATVLKRYLAALKYRVRVKTAKIDKKRNDTGSMPAFLFYGTKVSYLSIRGNHCRLQDAGGNIFEISKNCLESIGRYEPIKQSDIVKEAKKFLGVPYLWGGIGPFGLDCSGFVRTIFGAFNIELPRDSRDQYKFGQKIVLNNIKPADLLFFKGHVALAINRELFIHSSLGEGGVAISSLNPKADNFRKDLLDAYIGARRVLP